MNVSGAFLFQCPRFPNTEHHSSLIIKLFSARIVYKTVAVLFLERNVAVVLHYRTHFFNHQHAKVVKMFMKGFSRILTM